MDKHYIAIIFSYIVRPHREDMLRRNSFSAGAAL